MQEKKMTIAKKVLLELIDYLEVDGFSGLADFLGVKVNTIYSWSKRGKLVDTGVILDKCPELRKDWLESGQWKRFRDEIAGFIRIQPHNVVPARITTQETILRGADQLPPSEQLKIAEMILAAARKALND